MGIVRINSFLPSCQNGHLSRVGADSGSRVLVSVCSAEEAVEVPLEAAWALWDEKASIPNWMPWIKSVEACQTLFHPSIEPPSIS